jgi:hypothetical protein
MSGGGGITTVRSGSDLSCLISCCSTGFLHGSMFMYVFRRE